MRVFLTGATGFIGSAIIPELKAAGHQVLGLTRSEAGAEALRGAGVEPHHGELTDTDSLLAGVRQADGVIHCAFIHDFSQYAENCEIDRQAATAMTAAMEGSGRPFVLTSGTGMAGGGRVVTELDEAPREGWTSARGATEHVVADAAKRGVRASIVRLPQVHGERDGAFHGFVPMLIDLARRKGFAAYLGDGANCWPTVHRLDAARLYRLALEKAAPGARLHAVATEGVAVRAIAETIGEGLGVPVRSLAGEDAAAYFEWMFMFAGMDNRASNAITCETMGWRPQGPDLLTDLRTAGYFREPIAA